jgi:GMP synthase (glutamine-hydrolysing)
MGLVAIVKTGSKLPSIAARRGDFEDWITVGVTDREPWSEATAEWLGAAIAAELPVLAICYGHQLLAHALGGRVAKNPRGREIGTVEVALAAAARGDDLLGEFPGALRVQSSHLESVLELPPGATRLATTKLDPNHAFRIGRSAWGVQFHPEFDADVVRGYIAARRDIILEEGIDADALSRDAVDGPDGTAVLRRFARILEA